MALRLIVLRVFPCGLVCLAILCLLLAAWLVRDGLCWATRWCTCQNVPWGHRTHQTTILLEVFFLFMLLARVPSCLLDLTSSRHGEEDMWIALCSLLFCACFWCGLPCLLSPGLCICLCGGCGGVWYGLVVRRPVLCDTVKCTGSAYVGYCTRRQYSTYFALFFFQFEIPDICVFSSVTSDA